MPIQSDSNDYLYITATVVAKTPKAVLLTNESAKGWVPRSCIHAASDDLIDDASPGDTITIKVREWIVDRIGL